MTDSGEEPAKVMLGSMTRNEMKQVVDKIDQRARLSPALPVMPPKLSVDEIIAKYMDVGKVEAVGQYGDDDEPEAESTATNLKHFGRWVEPSDIHRASDYMSHYFYSAFPGSFAAWKKSGRPVRCYTLRQNSAAWYLGCVFGAQVCFWACCGNKRRASKCCTPNTHVQQALTQQLRKQVGNSAIKMVDNLTAVRSQPQREPKAESKHRC